MSAPAFNPNDFTELDKTWAKIMKNPNYEKGDIEYDFIRSEFYQDYDVLKTYGVQPDDIHWQIYSYLYYSIVSTLPNMYTTTVPGGSLNSDLVTRFVVKQKNGIYTFVDKNALDSKSNKLTLAQSIQPVLPTLSDNDVKKLEQAGVHLKLPTGATTYSKFIIDLEKLANHRMNSVYTAKVEKTLELDNFDDADFAKPENRVYVDNGKFYGTKNGAPVLFNLREGDKCFNTGATNCIGMLNDCILNNKEDSLPACITHFDNMTSAHFDSVRADILEMHPSIAIKLLKTFGFRKREVYNEGEKRHLYQVQEVSDWLNSMSDNTTIANARKNTNLLRYLNLLVQYVNRNPGVLNKGYSPSNASNYSPTSSYYATSYGIKKRYEPVTEEEYNKYKLRQTIIHTKAPTPQHITMPYGFPMLYQTSSQFGGSYYGQTNNFVIKGYNNTNCGPNFVKKQLDFTINELTKRGKRIDPDLVAKINKDIDNMRHYEDQALTTLRLIEEYKRIIDLNQDYRQDFISEDNLRILIDKSNKIANNTATISDRIMKALLHLESTILPSNNNSNLMKL